MNDKKSDYIDSISCGEYNSFDILCKSSKIIKIYDRLFWLFYLLSVVLFLFTFRDSGEDINLLFLVLSVTICILEFIILKILKLLQKELDYFLNILQ